MFLGNVEFVAYERQKDLLREAEQRRLIKSLQHQQFGRSGKFRRVTLWIGSQMVRWGLKLQGQSLTLPPQAATASAIDTECCC